jgi:hypothetical protein
LLDLIESVFDSVLALLEPNEDFDGGALRLLDLVLTLLEPNEDIDGGALRLLDAEEAIGKSVDRIDEHALTVLETLYGVDYGLDDEAQARGQPVFERLNFGGRH